MPNIIVTTPEELRAIVSEAVSGVLPKHDSSEINLTLARSARRKR